MTGVNWNRAVVDGPVSIPIYGTPDPVTGERPITGYEPGCHLNVGRSAVPAGAEAYEITPDPATPVRVMAGDRPRGDGSWELTSFLLFPNEAAAAAVMPGLVVEVEP